MKNLIICFGMVGLFGVSCSTKFKVGADYKDVTIVYGLLSMQDTAHYIKINKGYYDEELNNLELAKNPDSLYFNNLDVKIEVLNSGHVIQTIPLNKVNLVDEGYIKDQGTFATTPNYAYKFKNALDPSKIYRLVVKNLSTGKEIQGETPIITNSPSSFQFVEPQDPVNDVLEFSNPDVPKDIRWQGPASAAFYDFVVRFKYQEVNVTHIADTAYIVKDIPVVQNVPSKTGQVTASVSSVNFFKQLNSLIPQASSDIKRYIDTPDIFVLAGGQVLKTYIDVNSAQSGITYDQIKPNYTNLTGDDAYGFLSTRGQIEMDKIKFSSETIDSIKIGSFTKGLNFVGISNK